LFGVAIDVLVDEALACQRTEEMQYIVWDRTRCARSACKLEQCRTHSGQRSLEFDILHRRRFKQRVQEPICRDEGEFAGWPKLLHRKTLGPSLRNPRDHRPAGVGELEEVCCQRRELVWPAPALGQGADDQVAWAF